MCFQQRSPHSAAVTAAAPDGSLTVEMLVGNDVGAVGIAAGDVVATATEFADAMCAATASAPSGITMMTNKIKQPRGTLPFGSARSRAPSTIG